MAQRLNSPPARQEPSEGSCRKKEGLPVLLATREASPRPAASTPTARARPSAEETLLGTCILCLCGWWWPALDAGTRRCRYTHAR